MDSCQLIDALGGTAEVARLCDVKQPSVSEWRKNGIPAARLMYLRAVRPDLFVEPSREQRDRRTGADRDPPHVMRNRSKVA